MPSFSHDPHVEALLQQLAARVPLNIDTAHEKARSRGKIFAKDTRDFSSAYELLACLGPKSFSGLGDYFDAIDRSLMENWAVEYLPYADARSIKDYLFTIERRSNGLGITRLIGIKSAPASDQSQRSILVSYQRPVIRAMVYVGLFGDGICDFLPFRGSMLLWFAHNKCLIPNSGKPCGVTESMVEELAQFIISEEVHGNYDPVYETSPSGEQRTIQTYHREISKRIERADGAKSLPDFLNFTEDRFRGWGHPFGQTWMKYWHPWLSSLEKTDWGKSSPLTERPPPEPPAPEPEAKSPPRKRRPPRARSQFKKSVEQEEGDEEIETRGLPAKRRREPAIDEGDEEVTPKNYVIEPRKSRKARQQSIRSQIDYAGQEIRQQNKELLATHFSVLSTIEVPALIESLGVTVGAPESSSYRKSNLERAALKLVLCLGKDPAHLAKTIILRHKPFSPSFPYGLYLDLTTGYFWQPFWSPDYKNKIAIKDSALYEDTTMWAYLPLPPPILADFREHVTADITIGELLQTAALEVNLRALIKTLDIPPLSKSLTRIRKWLSANIFQVTRDLPATMAICGDTFTRPESPLFYYTPKQDDLAAAYAKVTWPVFGAEWKISAVTSDVRVGFAHLVKPKIAEKALSVLANSLNITRVGAETSLLQAFDIHHRYVPQVAQVICVPTTHRPTDDIFDLRRFDFDLHSHAAIVNDKDIDPAHINRLASTIEILSMTLRFYLAHLKVILALPGLSEQLRIRIRGTLDGVEPLLFDIAPDQTVVELSVKTWRALLPVKLQALRANWNRAFMANALREVGASGIDTCIQKGHLEAAGYPFSATCPVPPIEFLVAMRGHINLAVKPLGLATRSGLSTEAVPVEDGLGPLRTWNQEIRKHQDDMRSYLVRHKIEIRARSGKQRRMAKAAAIKLLNVYPDGKALVKDLQNYWSDPSNYKKPKRDDMVFHPNAAEYMVARMNADTEGNLVFRTALHNAVALLLRAARKKIGWTTPEIGLWLSAPNQSPSRFFRGMMRARMQILCIRDHFCNLDKPSEGIDAIARCVLSLVLFGAVDHAPDALKIVRSKAFIRRTPAVESLLLVQPEEQKINEVLGFQGLAALAILALRDSRKVPDNIDESMVNVALLKLLPTWAHDGNSQDLLQRLCSTSQVNNLIEQSGLSHTMNDPSHCKAAPMDRQLLLLEGRLERRKPNSDIALPKLDAIEEDDEVTDALPSDAGVILAKKHYRELCQILDAPKAKDKYFPRLKKTVALTEHRKKRPSIIDELRLYIKESIPPVCRALGTYALDMYLNGTDQTPEPAYASIHTYICAIGERMVEECGSDDLYAFDPDRFEDLYLATLGSRVGDVGHRAAAQIRNFHQCLMATQSVAMFDSSCLGSFKRDESSIHADFVTYPEYIVALRILHDEWNPDTRSAAVDSIRWPRLCLATAVAMVLQRRASSRISEAGISLHRDLVLTKEGKVLFRTRSNRYETLKSRNAPRLRDLSDISDFEKSLLESWSRLERRSLAKFQIERLPLLSELDRPLSPISVSTIRVIIQWSLRNASLNDQWPHLLRHGFANDQCVTPRTRPISVSGAMPPAEMTRRDVDTLRVEMGQGSFTTTAGYIHLPWAFKNVDPHLFGVKVGRRSLAAVANMTPGNVDQIRARALKRIPIESRNALEEKNSEFWMDALFKHLSEPPDAISSEPFSDSLDHRPNRAKALTMSKLLTIVERVNGGDDLHLVARAFGLSAAAIQRIEDGCAYLQKECHYRLIPIKNQKKRISKACQPRIRSKLEPGQLLSAIERGDECALFLINSFVEWHRPGDTKHSSGITFPREIADRFSTCLQKFTPMGRALIVSDFSNTERDAVLKVDLSSAFKRALPHLYQVLAAGWVWQHMRKISPA